MMLKHIFILLVACYQFTHATIIVKGNATNGATFTNPVVAKAYDRFNGVLYLGLSGNVANNYAISYIYRSQGFAQPVAFPYAPTGVTSVLYLALVTQEGEPRPDLAVVPGNFPRRSNVITFDGSYLQLQADLLDASGAVGVNGAPTSGIVDLAASNAQIFSAVKSATVMNNPGNFGQLNSGIAMVAFTPDFQGIFQTPAQVGDPGIKAQRFDPTTPNIKIGTTNPTFLLNQADMFWDSTLQRLYIGVVLASGNLNGDGAISVVPARVVNNTKLVYTNIAPATAFASGNNNNIVGAVSPGLLAKSVGAYHVRTMHTSAGPAYLIVNGGVMSGNLLNAPKNTLYALPLVNLNDPTNPLQGVLADKNAFDATTKQFMTPAITNADLPEITDAAVAIGDGPLPIQNTTPVFDVVVIQDTVYVSMNNQLNVNNDNGIWYSQALFDQEGKIASWTPWAKRAFPYNGFPMITDPNQGRVAFFDVDAVTSKIWAVEGSLLTSVATTSWDFGPDAGVMPTITQPNLKPTSLAGVLNSILTDGSYSVLDLDNATPGLEQFNNQPRYTLFGGVNKVVFTVVSFRGSGVAQQVITSFNNPQVLFVSQMPSHAGTITSLAYSQQEPNNLNYFFAGSQNGLFVFADGNGNGFLSSSLSFLDLPPFSTGIWQRAPNIDGSITALYASGNSTTGSLYVLTNKVNSTQGFESKLYRIPYQATVAAMFDPTNIHLIAQSGVNAPGSDLSTTFLFTGIQGVTDGSVEQIILTTNSGVFASTADQTNPNLGILSALNQQDAAWQLQPDGTTLPYTGIFAPITAVNSTTWPVMVAANRCQVFDQSIVRQLSALPSPNTVISYGFDPLNFNAKPPTDLFSTLDAIIYMWSDGARRIFIMQRSQDVAGGTKLFSIPFNRAEWNLTSPESLVLNDPALQELYTFYWVQHIGATGILMAGYNCGVVALE